MGTGEMIIHALAKLVLRGGGGTKTRRSAEIFKYVPAVKVVFRAPPILSRTRSKIEKGHRTWTTMKRIDTCTRGAQELMVRRQR